MYEYETLFCVIMVLGGERLIIDEEDDISELLITKSDEGSHLENSEAPLQAGEYSTIESI